VAKQFEGNCPSQAMQAYLEICSMLPLDMFVERQLPFLKDLTKHHQREVRSAFAASVGRLFEILRPSWFSDFEDIVNLMVQDLFSVVRKSMCDSIPDLLRHITEKSSFSFVGGVLLKLSKDPCNAVRKSVIETLPNFADAVDSELHSELVLPIFTNFAKDRAQVIRRDLCCHVGEIITYIGDAADEEMISLYESSCKSLDADVSFACAFSFPGVIGALGVAHLPSWLDLFDYFLSNEQLRIRRSIAFGLWLYAHLFESRRLLDVILMIMNDDAAVSVGIFTNFHQIVRFVSDAKELAFIFENPRVSYGEWRIRRLIAEQIRYCLEYFEHTVLFTCAKELLTDDIAVVRNEAVQTCAALYMKSDSEALKELSQSKRYRDRLCVASVILGLDPENRIDQVELVRKLANDQVSLVRMKACEVIENWRANNEEIVKYLDDCVMQRSNDEDEGVRRVFSLDSI
jgi:hypothetical protein